MTTLELTILVGFIVWALLFLLPTVVYLSIRMGRLAYLQAGRRFCEMNSSRKEGQHGPVT